MKKCLQRLSIAAVALMCGCVSSRLAYRYGDGLSYDGVDGIDVRQRFHIRSISFKDETQKQSYFAKFQEPLPDVHAVAGVVPELFSQGERTGDLPLDVTVRLGEIKGSSDFWNMMAALFSLFIVPIEISHERTSFIEIWSGGEKIVPDATFTRFDDSHTSVILPLGLIPYSPKEGCQENVFGESAFRGYGPEETNAFVRIVARNIARQLKRHALERLKTPDVDFDFNKE